MYLTALHFNHLSLHLTGFLFELTAVNQFSLEFYADENIAPNRTKLMLQKYYQVNSFAFVNFVIKPLLRYQLRIAPP